MLVRVTQEHIDKRGETPCNCPIALAIKDLPDFHGKEVAVWPGSVCVGYRHNDRFRIVSRYNMDILVTGWLMNYDDSKFASPFSFDLDTTKDYARKDQ